MMISKPVPSSLRHRIVPNAAGGFDLVTHYGYGLYSHEDRDVVADYYAGHCPAR